MDVGSRRLVFPLSAMVVRVQPREKSSEDYRLEYGAKDVLELPWSDDPDGR